MAQWFSDERMHKARKYYLCDRCGDYILAGHKYTRRLWRPNRDRLFVERFHFSPDCPAEPVYEDAQPVLAAVAYRIVVENRVALLRNGESVIEPHLVCVPVTEHYDSSDPDDGEDIPF